MLAIPFFPLGSFLRAARVRPKERSIAERPDVGVPDTKEDAAESNDT
jgi:hypothetical protein